MRPERAGSTGLSTPRDYGRVEPEPRPRGVLREDPPRAAAFVWPGAVLEWPGDPTVPPLAVGRLGPPTRPAAGKVTERPGVVESGEVVPDRRCAVGLAASGDGRAPDPPPGVAIRVEPPAGA